jgi:N6-adenosine-specific RNA methylase IME4
MKPVQVWYIDAPWHYAQRCTHSKTKFGGGTTAQYPTMRDQELLTICEYIKANSAKDAVMFSWCVTPKIFFCLYFMIKCGFKIVNKGFAWEKINADGSPFLGPGYYTRANTEDAYEADFAPDDVLEVPDTYKEFEAWLLEDISRVDLIQDCYFGRRGGTIVPAYQGVNQVVRHPLMGHSRKPPEIYDRIERLYPDHVKCEVFARNTRPGWISIGNEIDGRDVRAALSKPLPDTTLNLDNFVSKFLELQQSGLSHWQVTKLLV